MTEATNPTTTTTTTKSPALKPVRGPAPYALSDLILVPTTVPEIIQKTWTNNMEEWAKGVPEDKYHARERHLAATAFSSEGRLVTWVLVPKPGTDVTEPYRAAVGEGGVKGSFMEDDVSKENLERILGALETYERPGLVARTEEGEEGVKDVNCMSVASVYVPSKYRHHGYGHLMMKLLWEEMESQKIAFTFLYSDLGPDFYGDFGWTPRTCTQILIPTTMTLPTPPMARTRGSVKPITLEPVATDAELQELITQDALLVRQDLETRLATAKINNDKKTKTIVAVTPEIRAIQWLFARSYFNASVIFSQNHSALLIQTDLKFGVRVPGSETQFVLWHHDFTDDNLFILRWRLDPSSSPEEDTDAIALAFAQAAKDEAKKWGLSKVVFWNGDEALASLLGLKVETRKDSIPSLGLLNTVYPGHQPEELEWVLNQKYSWC